MKKLLFIISIATNVCVANQTSDLTPILFSTNPPFKIIITRANFSLPAGLQSAVAGHHKSDYLFMAGRTNGLHGFNNDGDNFPPNMQNTTVFVINPCKQTVQTRSLHDPESGLTQQQIDSLSVTSAQFYQKSNTLYITGGYGVDTATGNFSTKDTLTAINVKRLIKWVTRPDKHKLACQYIRQISDPLFQVTGGHMYQASKKNPTLLIFGQDFESVVTPTSNGEYTEQVRRFCIQDNGKSLRLVRLQPTAPDPSYRRRDLNVVPIIKRCNGKKIFSYVALSGVFTPDNGIWTVPVNISANGSTYMPSPELASTFKQGMNNYTCAHVELSSKDGSNYIVLFGGITFEYFEDGQFKTDAELPFTNETTVIVRSVSGNFSQYLLPTQYPDIPSTGSNPGNTLLFGASSKFMPAPGISKFSNGVLKLSKIKEPTVIGYIIGGIQSTLPNTSVPSDTAASPYIFNVTLVPC